MLVGCIHESVAREGRNFFCPAKAGPNQAPLLAHRIGRGLDRFLKLSSRLLGASRMVPSTANFQPCTAANAALLDTAERQRSPAMRAKLVKHADLAVGVPEDDQPLAKQRNAQGIAIGFGIWVETQTGSQ